MCYKTVCMEHPTRLELICVGLLVKLVNHYTTRGAHSYFQSFLLRWSIRPQEWSSLRDSNLTQPRVFANYRTTQYPQYTLLSNLQCFLLGCDIRLYEWSTQQDSNSLVRVYWSSLLTIIPPKVPIIKRSYLLSFLLGCGIKLYE